MTGVARQAIVSAACKMADVWPFAVKMLVWAPGLSFPLHIP
jgi:hypothetical protein